LGGDHGAGDHRADRTGSALGRDPLGPGRPQSRSPAEVGRRRGGHHRIPASLAAVGQPRILRLPPVLTHQRSARSEGYRTHRLGPARAGLTPAPRPASSTRRRRGRPQDCVCPGPVWGFAAEEPVWGFAAEEPDWGFAADEPVWGFAQVDWTESSTACVASSLRTASPACSPGLRPSRLVRFPSRSARELPRTAPTARAAFARVVVNSQASPTAQETFSDSEAIWNTAVKMDSPC